MANTERRNFWIGLAALLVLVIVAIGLAFLAWRYLPALLPQLSPPVITAIVTITGSVITLILTKKWDRLREIQQEHRRQKSPIYGEFIEFLFKLFLASKENSRLTEEETTAFVVKFMQGLTIWGSNDVIHKYGKFRQTSADDPDNAAATAAALEDILFSIRSDLGHPSSLRRGDLLRLFINDLDQIMSGRPSVPSERREDAQSARMGG